MSIFFFNNLLIATCLTSFGKNTLDIHNEHIHAMEPSGRPTSFTIIYNIYEIVNCVKI